MDAWSLRPLLGVVGGRAWGLSALVHLLLALGLCLTPLLGVLGFERALASALLTTATSPIVAASAFRKGRKLGCDPWSAWLASVLAQALLLFPTLVVGLGYELWSTPCDLGSGALFVLLLGGGNLVFGTSLTFLVFALVNPNGDRSRQVFLLVYLVEAAWLFSALLRLYDEPQIFLYVTPFGFWPGSLYDEALTVTPALWGFRALALALALAFALLARARLGPRLDRPRFDLGDAALPFMMALLAAATAWSLAEQGDALGFDRDRQSLKMTLSHRLETEHFVLHADPSVDRTTLLRLAEDHEHRHAQLSRFFGRAPEGKVTSFIYADAAQKGALIGAERTQIARPWVKEIHLNGAEVPHRIMKHELAHIFAGALIDGPFRVPLISGVVPNIGIIEGIAVAADWPVRELTVHQWAAAMLALDRLPSAARSLSPTGFWAISSSRAYVAFGSFVRWLVDGKGIEAFAKIYAGRSFEDAYGQSAEALEAEWRTFLAATVSLSPAALRRAEHRFSRPSIFEKTCARTAAALTHRGYRELRAGNLEAAEPLLEQVHALNPGQPRPLMDLARALSRQGDQSRAKAWTEKARTAPGITEASRLQAEELLGQLAWKDGDIAAARAAFERMRAAELSAAVTRLQDVRLHLIATSTLAEALRTYLDGEVTGSRALAELFALHREAPEDPILAYLLARRLLSEGAYVLSSRVLRGSPPERLPTSVLRDEARLMVGRAAIGERRYADALDAYGRAEQATSDPAVAAAARDGADRARFLLQRNRQSTGSSSGG